MPEQTAGGIWRLSFKDHLREAEYALVVRSSLPPILFLHKGCCGHDRKMGIERLPVLQCRNQRVAPYGDGQPTVA